MRAPQCCTVLRADGPQTLFELESDSFSDMEAVQKEANAKYQLWKSLYDFMEKSHNWTEDPVLDEAGEQQMSIEAIRGEVEDYAQRAYKMGKAAKEDLVRRQGRDTVWQQAPGAVACSAVTLAGLETSKGVARCGGKGWGCRWGGCQGRLCTGTV